MDVNDDTSAARIVAVLEALAQPSEEQPVGRSVSDLARLVGRDKSSVSRQLKSLIKLGLVEKNDAGKHVLGWRILTLAGRAGDQRLLLYAPAVMRQLSRQSGERVHLSIRRQDEVLTILTEGPLQSIGAVGWVGRTVPILGTSSGRALMVQDSDEEITAIFDNAARDSMGSNLPQTADLTIQRVRKAQADGFAIVVDEQEDGLSAVAAPIRDIRGQVTAAINISAPSFRIADKLDELARLIQRAAQHLSRAMHSPEPDRPQGELASSGTRQGTPARSACSS